MIGYLMFIGLFVMLAFIFYTDAKDDPPPSEDEVMRDVMVQGILHDMYDRRRK